MQLVYGKPTFSEIYTHFDSFLPSTNKIGMILHCYIDLLWICSVWIKFHLELVKLMDGFKSNGYPGNLINTFLKVFLANKHGIQEKVITLPYLGPLSLHTETKLRKSFKGILNFCKIQIVFKSQNKLANAFHFKDCIPNNLHLVSFINFSVESAMNPIMVNV